MDNNPDISTASPLQDPPAPVALAPEPELMWKAIIQTDELMKDLQEEIRLIQAHLFRLKSRTGVE